MTRKLFTTFDPASLGPLLALEQANTVVATTAVADINRTVRALYGKGSFSWFVEFAAWGEGTITNLVSLGLVKETASLSTYVGGDADGWGYRLAEGQIHNNGASTETVTAGTKGDIVGVLLDVPDGSTATATWFLNGIALHAEVLPDSGPWYPAASIGTTDDEDVMRVWINGGQRDFEFPAPGVDGWFDYPVDPPEFLFGSRDYMTQPTDPVPNEVYEGRFPDDAIEIVSQLAFWQDGGRSTQSTSTNVTIANGDGAFDAMIDHDLRETEVILSWVDQGQSILDAERAAKLLVDDVSVTDDGALRISMRGGMLLYDAPLQTRVFPPSADAGVAGKLYPILLGAGRSVTGVLVDPVNRIYQVSDRGLPGWGWVRDMGAPLDPNDIPPGYVIGDDFASIILETEAIGKLTIDASSTGGGTLPTLADDIWLGYGNPFTGSGSTLLNFDQQSGASFQPTNRAVLTSSSLLSRPYFALSTATMDAGRSYRYRVDVGSIPPPHSFGVPALTISTPSNITIAAFTSTGVFEGVFTSGSTFVPRIQLGNALTGTQAIVRSAYILEIPDDYEPSVLQAITLTEFVSEIMSRFGASPASWSREDTERIDAETGALGIGFFVSEAISVRQAIEMVLPSYNACAWVDDDDVLRFTRLLIPENELPIGDIFESDLLRDFDVRADLAPALSTQANYRRNWTVLAPTDFVSDFVTVPMATRRALSQPYQGIVATAIPLSPTYQRAVFAEPVGMLHDNRVDAQNAMDHLGTYYSVLRKFYATELPEDIGIQLGQVWRVTHSRHGLSAGRNLMVCRRSRRLTSGTIAVTFRG